MSSPNPRPVSSSSGRAVEPRTRILRPSYLALATQHTATGCEIDKLPTHERNPSRIALSACRRCLLPGLSPSVGPLARSQSPQDPSSEGTPPKQLPPPRSASDYHCPCIDVPPSRTRYRRESSDLVKDRDRLRVQSRNWQSPPYPSRPPLCPTSTSSSGGHLSRPHHPVGYPIPTSSSQRPRLPVHPCLRTRRLKRDVSTPTSPTSVGSTSRRALRNDAHLAPAH